MVRKGNPLRFILILLLLGYLYLSRELVKKTNELKVQAANNGGESTAWRTRRKKTKDRDKTSHAAVSVPAVPSEDIKTPTEVNLKSKKVPDSFQQNVTKKKSESHAPPAKLPSSFRPKIYKRGSWDNAPIVVEEYKLLFFTQGKVACTEFKKLMRRMMHIDAWNLHNEPKIPHDPRYNGLKYLYDFPLDKAMTMLTDPAWTRAIFVRDPKERFLSAYLDKAAKKEGLYVFRHCCFSPNANMKDSCARKASRSLKDFLTVVQEIYCCDPHWKPQSWRIDKELWPYVNFVGYFESLATDVKLMLEKINAWNEYGLSGWGKFGNESMFAQASSSKHKTNADSKLSLYFNESTVHEMVEKFYEADYERFHFNKNQHL